MIAWCDVKAVRKRDAKILCVSFLSVQKGFVFYILCLAITIISFPAYDINKLKTGAFMNHTENRPPFPIPNRDVIHVFAARIEEISRDRNSTLVTISYHDCEDCIRPEDLVRLVVNRDTVIHDERGRNIPVSELEQGMIVDASFSSAMTRSIPPQTQAFLIRVIRRSNRNTTTTGRITEVNNRGNYIITMSSLNPSSRIRFNLSPNTILLDPSGRRLPLSILVPGLRVRVEHANFMTASIPPQTTAFVIQILRQ
ncbi:MAG: hypothetical protein K2L07_10640 [Lachnospiraceae bacterium]|nr:hypothetical protein [Lachnospiraceae bacterium]